MCYHGPEMDWAAFVSMAGLGFVAGAFGALLGIGGGVFVVPYLTLVLRLPIHVAIGTSMVTVIANSNAAAATYVRAGLANIRLGMLMESTTVAGALAGALIAIAVPAGVLGVLFAAALCYASYSMLKRRPARQPEAPAAPSSPPSPLAVCYRDLSSGGTVTYCPRHVRWALLANVFTGGLAGLLGIGGGIVQVPVLNLVMGVPMKAAVATSALVLGLTGVTSSFIYFAEGYLYPLVIAPVAVGVFAGSRAGTYLAQRTDGTKLRRVFAVVLIVAAVPMVMKALGLGPLAVER